MKAQAQRISAPHSTFVKRVLPFVAMAAVSAGSYWSSRYNQHALETTVAVGVVGSIILWVLLRRGFWRMADTVEDHGDQLAITRWRTKVEVPIANVRELRRQPTGRGSQVTILLKAPCPLGSEITFLAPDRRTMPDIEDKLDALWRRVGSQR